MKNIKHWLFGSLFGLWTGKEIGTRHIYAYEVMDIVEIELNSITEILLSNWAVLEILETLKHTWDFGMTFVQ